MGKTVICKRCGAEMYKGVKKCPQCGKKNKKPTGLIILGIIVLLIIISSITDSIKEAKEKKVEYSWPQDGIAILLPQPDSEYGEIISESETYFSIDVYGVSSNEFNDYVSNCKKEGFSVDYQGSSSSYSAEDVDGNRLSIYYDDDKKEMDISLTAFEEKTEVKDAEESIVEETVIIDEAVVESTEEEKATEASTTEATDLEFRAWVDSYEEYMNEYVEFMKKYNESNGSDFSLLAEYANIMEKYSKFMEESEAVNEENLSVEDYKYYLDAQTRILEKLSEIQ